MSCLFCSFEGAAAAVECAGTLPLVTRHLWNTLSIQPPQRHNTLPGVCILCHSTAVVQAVCKMVVQFFGAVCYCHCGFPSFPRRIPHLHAPMLCHPISKAYDACMMHPHLSGFQGGTHTSHHHPVLLSPAFLHPPPWCEATKPFEPFVGWLQDCRSWKQADSEVCLQIGVLCGPLAVQSLLCGCCVVVLLLFPCSRTF